MRTPPSARSLALVPLFAAALLAPPAALADAPAPSPSRARFEVRFMSNMIDHHMMAVMTGEMCIEKAIHDELRAACEQIVTSQMQEIETMQMWLHHWYGITHEPQMTPGMQRQMDKLAALSGAEFEIALMTMMIRHHWQAIVKASQCVDKAYHGELIAMCEDIMAAQSAEIIEMREWLCSWYGVCRNGPGAPVTQ